jgi:predicted nucleic acid-binding Zn ribbon protein
MGDLQDPYGATAGFSPPAAAAAGGVEEAAEEDMRGCEGCARRLRKLGRARWRRWAGAEVGLRTGEKMEASRVAIYGMRGSVFIWFLWAFFPLLPQVAADRQTPDAAQPCSQDCRLILSLSLRKKKDCRLILAWELHFSIYIFLLQIHFYLSLLLSSIKLTLDFVF